MGSARNNAKEREKKEGQVRRKKNEWDRDTEGEIPNPSPGNRCTKRGKTTEQKTEEKNREQVPNPANPDHLVASYDPHGSYGLKMNIDKGKVIVLGGEEGLGWEVTVDGKSLEHVSI